MTMGPEPLPKLCLILSVSPGTLRRARWLTRCEPEYSALVITVAGELVSTPGMARFRA
jgi:hypothetical protein